MDISYLITPFCAWLVAGTIKFIINSIKSKKLAFDLIGYGSMPSNHASIVSSAVALIIFKQGLEYPAVVGAVALAIIVLLDAVNLRTQMGMHAKQLNKIAGKNQPLLREIMGHKPSEIIAGMVVGTLVAWVIYCTL